MNINEGKVKKAAFYTGLVSGFMFADKISGAALNAYKQATGKNPGIYSVIGGFLFDIYVGHVLGTFTTKYVDSIMSNVHKFEEFEKENEDGGNESEA